MYSIAFLSKRYDMLYEKADELLKEYNPCQFKNNSCTISKLDPSYNDAPKEKTRNQLCCCNCEYWDKGCTVKALFCKTWLCEPLTSRFTNPNYKKMRELRDKLEIIQNEAKRIGIKLTFRGSKKDTFRNILYQRRREFLYPDKWLIEPKRK